MKLNYCMFVLSLEHDKIDFFNKIEVKNLLFATVHKKNAGK